jgi:hypothetical protein
MKIKFIYLFLLVIGIHYQAQAQYTITVEQTIDGSLITAPDAVINLAFPFTVVATVSNPDYNEITPSLWMYQGGFLPSGIDLDTPAGRVAYLASGKAQFVSTSITGRYEYAFGNGEFLTFTGQTDEWLRGIFNGAVNRIFGLVYYVPGGEVTDKQERGLLGWYAPEGIPDVPLFPDLTKSHSFTITQNGVTAGTSNNPIVAFEPFSITFSTDDPFFTNREYGNLPVLNPTLFGKNANDGSEYHAIANMSREDFRFSYDGTASTFRLDAPAVNTWNTDWPFNSTLFKLDISLGWWSATGSQNSYVRDKRIILISEDPGAPVIRTLQLPAPTDLSIENDNLTFTPVANATSYTVYVYNSANSVVYSEPNFASDSPINYSVPGAYTVKVQAIGNEVTYSNSEFSEAVRWVTIDLPEIVSANATSNITYTSADVEIEVEEGTYSVDKIRLAGNGLDVRLDKTSNNIYTILGLSAGTDYSFTVTAIDTEGNESAEYRSKLEFTTPQVERYSEYCSYLFNPENGGNTELGLQDAAYFTWETTVNGEIIITISPYDSDNTETFFRGNGIDQGGITVNGDANTEGKYFIRTINESKTQITLIPSGPIPANATISYTGTLTYKTLSGNDENGNNLQSPAPFTAYTYGTNCSNAPIVTLSKNTIFFTPQSGIQSFSLSGINLLSPLVLIVPKGLNINPSTIIPDLERTIENQSVEITWEDGFSGNGVVNISGGGLAYSKQVIINSTGFSEYCNSLLSQDDNGTTNLAYMSIYLNEEKTVLSFHIDTYETGGTAVWNANSIPFENIKLNDESTNATRSMSSDNKILTITFDTPLVENDRVTFGGPLVWTINYPVLGWNNGNCFINPIKTYTVGLGCDLDSPVWIAGDSNDWNDPDNWSTGSVPGSINHIIIPASTNYPTIPTGTTMKSITFENGAGAEIGEGGSITVSEAVKVEYTVEKGQWYSVGFPFAIDRVYSKKLDRSLVPYDEISGGHFWLKTYDGAENIFNFANTINANTGYIVQFPEYFDDTKITFISAPDQSLSNSGSLDAGNDYELQANPHISHYTLASSATEHYYKYNPDNNKYVLLEGQETILPFESVVTFSNPMNLSMRQTIGDGSQAGPTGIALPLPADDPVIALRYYTLYGVEIQKPLETGVYIVKKIHASREEEIVKTVYIKK